jgi:SagB-type dehydrogenase family enzyme
MTNTNLSIAQHYHQRTKYDPQTLQKRRKTLDWSQQPSPFKEYKIGTSIPLKEYINTSQAELGNDPKQIWWQRLSRLLYETYGITAKVETVTGEPVYLRAAPSAGGLYPAEIYLIARGNSFMQPGLYYYQPRNHSLVHFWESDVWQQLQDACFWYPTLSDTQLALVVTAVFFRSQWRYEDRAYRRILLDTGHLLGNLELSGSIADFRPHLIGGFADRQVNNMLFLDSTKEGAIAVAALADRLELQQNLPPVRTALPSATQTEYPDLAEGELLSALHQATQIEREPETLSWKPTSETEKRADKYNFPFCTKVSIATQPIHWGEDLQDLEKTILKRRSTRRYSGEEISLEELKSVLHFTYHPQDYITQGLDREPDYFDLSLVSTFIAVQGVSDLEDGCYYYAPKAQELRQIRFKNFRDDLHYLCLGQDLGKNAAAVLFHTADLSKAIEKYGDRAYRYLHLDAGHLGQRLNLVAIYLNLGVSGIAGFFDDQVNEVLGIPTDEAVLYITTFGRPITALA